MKVTSQIKNHLVVDNFLNPKELDLVWRELDYMTSPNRMYDPSNVHSGSAKQDGKPLKQNMVAPLGKIYNELIHSDIFNVLGKIYGEEFSQIMDDMGNEFRYYNGSTHPTNSCFISYYENNDFYKLHRDNAILTFLFWCNKEPIRFKGGDLTLPEIGVDVEYKNNRLVVFPSHLLHSVSPIEMISENEPLSGYGRYCISYFMYLNVR